MNTYVQDNLIPIYISLQYGREFLKFPINPDNLTKEIPSESETVEIEGLGQVSIPTTPKLAKISISSFFWQEVNYVPSFMYVSWLERWQRSKKPATLIVTRFDISMQVTCESFKHWIKAGEEEDIYFELSMQEYRPYGAKKLNVKESKTFLQSAKLAREALATLDNNFCVLVEIPRITRAEINKKTYQNPYSTVEGDTLLSITKKITGSTDNWKLLYDENSEVFGDVLMESAEIPVGTKIIIPNAWINNS